jgi:hypothetical protein
MVLSDVEETVTSTDIDEETFEEIINVSFPAFYIQPLHTTVFRPPGAKLKCYSFEVML